MFRAMKPMYQPCPHVSHPVEHHSILWQLLGLLQDKGERLAVSLARGVESLQRYLEEGQLRLLPTQPLLLCMHIR